MTDDIDTFIGEDDEFEEGCNCPACQREAEGYRPDVMAIHRVQKVAILDNLNVVPVTHWFDSTGEECDPKKAVTCVCGADGVGWYAVDLTTFDYVTRH